MKIEILLNRVTYFGDPFIRCTLDENAPSFDGPSQDTISVDLRLSPGYHELVITHFHKKDSDHVLDNNGNILIDKHVEIKGISIDDIAFTVDELREGQFYPVYNRKYYDQCISRGVILPLSISPNLYLGHNGTWKISFNYPFVEYIINKRKGSGVNLQNSIYQSDVELLQRAKEWFTNAPDIIWKD